MRKSTLSELGSHIQEWEDRLGIAHETCKTCTASAPAEPIRCESLDCPWFYERHKSEAGMEVAAYAGQLVEELGQKGDEEESEEESEEEEYGEEYDRYAESDGDDQGGLSEAEDETSDSGTPAPLGPFAGAP
jgi:hypothetical protein